MMSTGARHSKARSVRLAHERPVVRRQLAHVDSLVERLGASDRRIVRRAFVDMAQAAAGKPH
jgi:RNA polymerase sigma-32 factor